MLKWILIYIFGGILINYGTVFIVWGYLAKLCGPNVVMFNELLKKYESKRIGMVMRGFPEWLKFVITQIFWPVNVRNTIAIGVPAIKDAIRIQNNSVNEPNEKER